jgi:hypothetical protein
VAVTRGALTSLPGPVLCPALQNYSLERFPIRWNHLIEKESLSFKELEHVQIEKVEQLF